MDIVRQDDYVLMCSVQIYKSEDNVLHGDLERTHLLMIPLVTVRAIWVNL
jgi:hypothetical protein